MNILLVEDDPGIGKFIVRGLQAEGYKVEWQTLGRRARPRLASGLFHAAVLDLGLPDVDGLDLCSELREAGIDLPVIMLTARSDLHERLEGFRCGADDYLPKPFSFEELLARLAVSVRRSRSRSDERLSLGEMLIDLRARSVRVAGNELDLSKKEFDLLHCLAARAGQAVTRSQILDEVWGPDAEVTENVVDVYVGYIRRHLAAHSLAPELATIRGVGFLLRHGTKA